MLGRIAADVQAVATLPGRTELAIGLSGGLDRAAFLAELEREPRRVRATSDTGLSCREYACDAMLAAFEVAPGVVLLLARLDVHPWDGKCTQQINVEIWTHTSQGLAGGAFLPDTIDCAGGINYPSRGTSTSLYWADVDGAPPFELLSAHSDDSDTRLDVFGYDANKGSYRQMTEGTPSAVLQMLSAQLEGATAFARY